LCTRRLARSAAGGGYGADYGAFASTRAAAALDQCPLSRCANAGDEVWTSSQAWQHDRVSRDDEQTAVGRHRARCECTVPRARSAFGRKTPADSTGPFAADRRRSARPRRLRSTECGEDSRLITKSSRRGRGCGDASGCVSVSPTRAVGRYVWLTVSALWGNNSEPRSAIVIVCVVSSS
jgi:hypothetical protein